MNHYLSANQTIESLLNQVNNGDTIFLLEGKFKEKLVVKKNNITIIGKGQDKTEIFYDDYYYKIINDNIECNTFRTYTVKVLGNNVTFKNLTISNVSTPSSKYGQAVALHVMGNNFKLIDSHLKGAQDTLFTGPYPDNLKTRYKNFIQEDELNIKTSFQSYINSVIEGDTDFIFGGATAFFKDCLIKSIGSGYVAAPSHTKETPYGYLFLNCTLVSPLENTYSYLARPWRDYGCTAFINCKISNHIYSLGFNKWEGTNRDKTCRFYEYPLKEGRVQFTKEIKNPETYVDDFLDYFNKNI